MDSARGRNGTAFTAALPITKAGGGGGCSALGNEGDSCCITRALGEGNSGGLAGAGEACKAEAAGGL